MTATAAQRQQLGAYGEGLAERYLRDQGLVVLERNWRCAEGEIDLVLRDGTDLVACEVKTRRGMLAGGPHQALTPTKLARLHRLIQRWIVEHGVRPSGVRVDLVAVLCPRSGSIQIDHIRGLF